MSAQCEYAPTRGIFAQPLSGGIFAQGGHAPYRRGLFLLHYRPRRERTAIFMLGLDPTHRSACMDILV